jgi:4-amino-4-deoxy-L-arabinose transferase-like glycosyltransferase
MRSRGPLIAGIVLGVATTAAYLVGSNRSFGYDAAATFANFIATPSLWDAFAVHSVIPTIDLKSVASNDHVLLSLISHAIYSATGSRTEVVYRLLPALAAGGTVGVMATALSRKYGMLAGASAALYIATVPLFVDNGRDLRGYTLATLLAVLASSLLLASAERTLARRIAYALLMGLAIAAQLFAAVVLVAHVAWVVTRKDAQPLVQLAPAWIGAALIGGAANANIQFMELVQHGYPASMFNPDFPRDLVLFLLGAPVLLPIGLWLSAAALGLWTLRAEPRVWASVAVIAVAVAILWLGLKPAYLYPRFFIFLVPGCALLMAAAIARWKVLAPIVVVGAVAAAIGQAAGYTQDPLALQQAAAFVDRAHAAGQTACVIHADEQILAAYTSNFKVVSTADQLSGCDAVVVVSWNVDLALRDQAAQDFPRRTILPAYYPAVVLER